MSRNKSVDYTQYIHEYRDEQGRTRYAVAEYNEENAQYTCPMTANEIRDNPGCYAFFARTPYGFGKYLNRQTALRRARYLFGPRD